MTWERPRLLLAGDTALTVELGNTVDPAINARVIALDRAIAAAGLPGIVETVPTYRSLQIHYDPEAIAADGLQAAVERLAVDLDDALPTGRRWTVPVTYG